MLKRVYLKRRLSLISITNRTCLPKEKSRIIKVQRMKSHLSSGTCTWTVLLAFLSLTAAWPTVEEFADRGVLETAVEYVEKAMIMANLQTSLESAYPSDESELLEEEDATFEGNSEYRHVYSLDMQIPDETCPENFTFITQDSFRLCGKKTDGPSCDSITIPTRGQRYKEVRGRVRGYQYSSPDAFNDRMYKDIDGPYVDGVSITHGQNPRKHIFTFASGWRFFASAKEGTCPTRGFGDHPPDFVASNYTCDAAGDYHYKDVMGRTYLNRPLWTDVVNESCEDQECGYYFNFCGELSEPTTDDIELRICTDQSREDEDVRLDLIEIYIK